ncbi:hypothetical protein D3C84_1068910 [compost metagenome]
MDTQIPSATGLIHRNTYQIAKLVDTAISLDKICFLTRLFETLPRKIKQILCVIRIVPVDCR